MSRIKDAHSEIENWLKMSPRQIIPETKDGKSCVVIGKISKPLAQKIIEKWMLFPIGHRTRRKRILLEVVKEDKKIANGGMIKKNTKIYTHWVNEIYYGLFQLSLDNLAIFCEYALQYWRSEGDDDEIIDVDVITMQLLGKEPCYSIVISVPIFPHTSELDEIYGEFAYRKSDWDKLPKLMLNSEFADLVRQLSTKKEKRFPYKEEWERMDQYQIEMMRDMIKKNDFNYIPNY